VKSASSSVEHEGGEPSLLGQKGCDE